MDYDLNSYHSCKALNLKVFCWEFEDSKSHHPAEALAHHPACTSAGKRNG